MLELTDKDFKAVIIKKCFNKKLQTCLKQMKTIESLIKEIEGQGRTK